VSAAAPSVPYPKVSPDADAFLRRRLSSMMGQLSTRLDLTFERNPFRSLGKRIAIAGQSRTGGNLLCERLKAHGALVRQFFHLPNMDRELAKRPVPTLEAYCEAMIKECAAAGAGDTFGVKGSLSILAPLVLAGEFPEFLADWRFLYLKRTDTLKQAISHAVADLSGAWKSTKAGREVLDEEFDGQRIAFLMRGHLHISAGWEEIFRLYGIEPMALTYEELAADPDAVAARAAQFLGLDGPPLTDERFVKPPLSVQANSLNARWERRFIEEGWLARMEEQESKKGRD
jgi:LPS sulfotransferase NodH